MEITEEEFDAYRDVQYSGVTNMWNTALVSRLSALDTDQILFIMENYDKLQEKYGEYEGKSNHEF